MNVPKGKQVDHIDGNSFDTRKYNMRICTAFENGANKSMSYCNSSGVKGVGWDNTNQKWIAYIRHNYKFKHLGYYDNFEDAVTARRKVEIEIQGEFSRDYGDSESIDNTTIPTGRKINHNKIACNQCIHWNKNNDRICEILNIKTSHSRKCEEFKRKEGY